jgi:hypothetical protein
MSLKMTTKPLHNITVKQAAFEKIQCNTKYKFPKQNDIDILPKQNKKQKPKQNKKQKPKQNFKTVRIQQIHGISNRQLRDINKKTPEIKLPPINNQIVSSKIRSKISRIKNQRKSLNPKSSRVRFKSGKKEEKLW